MPRKPKQEKHTITVVVNGVPVPVVLHPPNGNRTSWYAYWTGLLASRSTGQRNLQDAIIVVENMVRSGGRSPRLRDAILSDEEFEQIQRVHFAKRKDKPRAEKTLQTFFDAVTAFKTIAAMDPINFQQPITLATPGICEAFQQIALTLPKNWRQRYPRGRNPDEVKRLSPNTVLKWSRALQAAFDRANRNAGKNCVRSVVDESRLLGSNPWNQFRWIEGVEKPVRQFDPDELLSFLDYLEREWSGVTVATALAKIYLWSACRQEEATSLEWSSLRDVAGEHHFEIVGKRGIRRWFRVPEELFQELLSLRSDSPFVLAAYNYQLRRFHERSGRPDWAANVGTEFKPLCLGDWFYDRLADWSATLPNGHAHPHIFRKTALQQAWVGDTATDERVAEDACVGKDVMMRHYVRVLREKSNRTYHRILAALLPELARRYGYVPAVEDALETQLQQAIENKDWAEVSRLSQELASRERPPTG